MAQRTRSLPCLRRTRARHGAYGRRICLSATPQRPEPHSKRLDQLKPCVTPSETNRSAGILTCCPSTTPFGLVLGPTNPGTICVALETLSLRWAGFSPALLLLMPTFSLPNAPRWVTPSASALFGMLLYRSRQLDWSLILLSTTGPAGADPAVSVPCLAPVSFRCRAA